jgi:aryl-alcohol dehydrogenase-like predicted oxidoreductase
MTADDTESRITIMQFRQLGKTGELVSEIGFGAWAIGASWGEVDDRQSIAALHASLDSGVTFIDTADVYGDGHSERLIAQVVKERGGVAPFIATKAGRRLPAQVPEGYGEANLRDWIDRSRANLDMDTLDLVQLHCPPTQVYESARVFDILGTLKAESKIKDYGVSVERIDEALKAITYAGVVSVQIIFNIFRQRVADEFLAKAKAANVAVIARVPLASGLLTGKMKADTKFESTDHRLFNRNGEAFDVGETFSGVPYDVALAAIERIRPLVDDSQTMAQFALRWILMFDAVTVAIPGAKNVAQAQMNANAAASEALSDETMGALRAIYDEDIKPHVHARW